MEQVLKVGIAGLVTIGIITALFSPGRTTVQGISAGGTAVSKVFHTAETGQA